MELTYDILVEIINDLARKGNIFSNEVQFQFALAQAIKDYNDFKEANIEVLLEPLILVRDENKYDDEKYMKKMYVDIVVKIEELYYPIELKYKTADALVTYESLDENNKVKVCTFNQGAEDQGSYDYIKDIHRLEQLVFKRFGEYDLIIKTRSKAEENKYIEITSPMFDYNSLGERPKLKKGFAIMITNNHKCYNKKGREDKNTKGELYYWNNFFLMNKKTLSGTCCWVNRKSGQSVERKGKSYEDCKVYEKEVNDAVPNCPTDKINQIELFKTYQIEWKQYDTSEKFKEIVSERSRTKHPFKYLIVEVSSEEK